MMAAATMSPIPPHGQRLRGGGRGQLWRLGRRHFPGSFAIKEKADPRFENWPAKAAKFLENFDPQVLNSIPEAVSESAAQWV